MIILGLNLCQFSFQYISMPNHRKYFANSLSKLTSTRMIVFAVSTMNKIFIDLVWETGMENRQKNADCRAIYFCTILPQRLKSTIFANRNTKLKYICVKYFFFISDTQVKKKVFSLSFAYIYIFIH